MKKVLYLMMLCVAFFGFSFANNMDNYQNTIKVKKLARLENQFLNYVQSRYDNVSKGIDGQLQSIFDEKMNGFEGINQNLDSVFISMQFDSPKKNYEEYVSELKSALAPYKEIETEIQNIKAGKSSVYVLSGDEVTAVNSQIVEIQKAFVNDFEKNIMENLLSYSGLQETGNMTFTVNTSYGNVVLKMSDYDTKMDFENNSQDMSVKMNIDFNLNIPGEASAQSGSIYMDLYMVMKGEDMYMTINDYSVSLSNADEGLGQSLQMLGMMKGKTIHIPAYSSTSEYNDMDTMVSSMKGTNSMMFIKKVVDVLKTDSLFAPFKKVDDGYKLMMNTDTLAKIFGENYMSFSLMNSAMIINENVDFTTEKGIYIDMSDATSDGYMTINKDSQGPILQMSVKGKSYNEGNLFDMTWKTQFLKLSLLAEGVNVNMDWENGKLDSTFDIMGSIIKIAGDYSKRLADLKISYNDNEIGYLKSTYDGKNGTYDMYLNLDMFKDFVEFLKSFELKFTGDVTVNTGSMNVTIPTDYIEMDKLVEGYLTIAE